MEGWIVFRTDKCLWFSPGTWQPRPNPLVCNSAFLQMQPHSMRMKMWSNGVTICKDFSSMEGSRSEADQTVLCDQGSFRCSVRTGRYVIFYFNFTCLDQPRPSILSTVLQGWRGNITWASWLRLANLPTKITQTSRSYLRIFFTYMRKRSLIAGFYQLSNSNFLCSSLHVLHTSEMSFAENYEGGMVSW